MTYFAALVGSLHSKHPCVIDEDGEIVAETKVALEVADIVAFPDEQQSEIAKVCLEAGTVIQYLTYGMPFAGYQIVCMETRHVKNAVLAIRNKTDKNDARGIAQLLRSSWYGEVHIKSMDSHHIRAMPASRKAVLDKCVDLDNEIHDLFKGFGIKLPPKLGHGAFDPRVRPMIEADRALRESLLPGLDARRVLYRTFRELDNRTCKAAHDEPVCQRLVTAPGVGFVTALTFKAAVDDPTRLKRSRSVAAH